MPRPITKPDLINTANEQFEKMWKLIDSIPDNEQNAAFNFSDEHGKKEAHWKRDKNLRDVFIHLYEWHQLLINWIKSNQNGESKPFLPEPYNWRTYGDMNIKLWEKHQSTSYTDSMKMLHDSHKKVMTFIELFSNEELFEKERFTWVGTSTLGSYCTSATASHYDWAIKKIKAHIKNCKAL